MPPSGQIMKPADGVCAPEVERTSSHLLDVSVLDLIFTALRVGNPLPLTHDRYAESL